MRNRNLFLSVIIAGLSLGTAWAIRGRFGHEQGAAWAGAIGALSVILLSKRNDWSGRVFGITLAAAFGWGISGVISYGAIVGYGRSTDFGSVLYGLLMLLIIGALYGFLGGGLFGLALTDPKNDKHRWSSLLTEMVAIGILMYGILINQLEWLMTPPRSEMWAACLGASMALAWYLVRNGHNSALNVAAWSALGAAFGFPFGNFLQVLGNASGVPFNFWNVMEYSIGFFGGAGMAYGTFTSSWPVGGRTMTPASNIIPILFVMVLIPFVVWDQSFVNERFSFILEGGGSAKTVFYFRFVALAAILLVAFVILRRNYSPVMHEQPRRVVMEFFVLFLGLYIFLSFLITGMFIHPLEQYLYVVNFFAIMFLLSRADGTFAVVRHRPGTWIIITLILIAVTGILSYVAFQANGI